MTNKEYLELKDIYDRCVIGGLLIPEDLKRGYYIISGREKDEPIVGVRKCKMVIFNWFQHQAQDFLDAFEATLLEKETLTDLEILEDELVDVMNLYDADPTIENKKKITVLKRKITLAKKKDAKL